MSEKICFAIVLGLGLASMDYARAEGVSCTAWADAVVKFSGVGHETSDETERFMVSRSKDMKWKKSHCEVEAERAMDAVQEMETVLGPESKAQREQVLKARQVICDLTYDPSPREKTDAELDKDDELISKNDEIMGDLQQKIEAKLLEYGDRMNCWPVYHQKYQKVALEDFRNYRKASLKIRRLVNREKKSYQRAYMKNSLALQQCMASLPQQDDRRKIKTLVDTINSKLKKACDNCEVATDPAN